MKLIENPFAILKASPLDNRRRLTEKADEAALLSGASIDDALMNLMQMNRRIVAEVNWFPGTHPKAAEAFVSYAKTLSADQTVPMPSLDGFGSPLAQVNALFPFFEQWPSSRPEYSLGLFRSLDLILSKITTAGVLALINQDRQTGGWEIIPDELTLAGPLEDRLREICHMIRDRMEQISSDDSLLNMINQLFSCADFDPQGTVGKAVSDAWAMRIHDQEETLREAITNQLSLYKELNVAEAQLNSLKSKIDSWCNLTAPLRKTAGPVRRAAHTICHDMRECIVRFVNNAETKPKKMQKTIPAVGGTRTITVTYQSKKDAILKAIALTTWLSEQFPEQIDQVRQLENDKNLLETIIVNEEAGAREALNRAK